MFSLLILIHKYKFELTEILKMNGFCEIMLTMNYIKLIFILKNFV